MVRSVCVYLASSLEVPEPLKALARHTGEAVARAGLTLVYGGASRGLMGVMADAALAAGGKVIGVIPPQLVERELVHRSLTELVMVRSMHERKAEMAARADAFAVLPGGFGTLDEAFEALTWRLLGLHGKPVVFVDPPDHPYWPPLLDFVAGAVETGTIRAAHARLIEHVEGADALIARLRDEPLHPERPPGWV
jgi:uncharacterized protein (TIGR00730 family)